MLLKVLFFALSIFLIAMGWPLATRRVRPNHWFGVRVPATFADEFVWYEANAVFGRGIMALGAVLLLVAFVFSQLIAVSEVAYALIYVAILGGGVLVLTVYTWRLANRLLQERRERPGNA